MCIWCVRPPVCGLVGRVVFLGQGEVFGLFTDEGVESAGASVQGWGRGLLMMEVLTLPVRETLRCLTLPSRALT